MKTVIFYSSTYNGNTLKIAESIAATLSADLIAIETKISDFDLSQYDLIGIGSAIHFGQHAIRLQRFVSALPLQGKNIFIFSTRCRPFLGNYHRTLKNIIKQKKANLVDEFSCVGFDRTGPWVLINGYNKNRPNTYGAVREGARARDFEEAIEWLVSAGMLNRVYNVSKMEHPLSAFDKLDQFKLFMFDTGLLKQMAGVDNSAILLKTDYQFKGPMTENYVLQQLKGQFEVEPRYYSDKNGEIDFVVQNKMEIIPIEVKGGEDRSANSFKTYVANNSPQHAYRFSKRGYRKDGDFTNLPLYLVRKTKDLL